jgi:hypothetical protein
MTQQLYSPTIYVWLGFKPSVSVTPDVSDSIADAVAPTVVLGSLSITPAVADSIADAVAPEVFPTLVIPAAADAAASVVDPTVILNSITVTPETADLSTTAVNPLVVVYVTVSSTADSAVTAVAPTVTVTGTPIVAAIHWFWDTFSEGWFKTQFATLPQDPVSVCVFDGDDPDDRVVLIGSDDGFVRYFDSSLATDDSTSMSAFVTLGPISMNSGAIPLILTEIQGITDRDGHSVRCESII